MVLRDSVRFVQVETVVAGRPVRVIESIRLREDLVQLYGVILRDALAVRETLTGNQTGQVFVRDAIGFLERLQRAQAATLADGVGVAQTEQLQSLAVILERLRIFDQPGGGARYNLSLVQGIRLVAKLARFFGADMTDTFGLDDDMFARMRAFAQVDDTIGVDAQLTPQLLVAVTVRDDIQLDAAQAVRMLFNPAVAEGVEFEAGYLAPDGSFTTWAMNTRTGAVTEYADYVFNSFASIGNRYLGASADGLFELVGDDDDGADIIARIRGGFLQFGGPQLSRLKEAYIASTGGEFVLQIRTADGLVYNYRVDARDGRSSKVHMGKGQRSRYFAFELISAGQDFELDTLEFVPIVMQRRV